MVRSSNWSQQTRTVALHVAAVLFGEGSLLQDQVPAHMDQQGLVNWLDIGLLGAAHYYQTQQRITYYILIQYRTHHPTYL